MTSLILNVCVLSRVRLSVTSWTVARQAPLSLEFSSWEHWSVFAISFSRGSSQPRDHITVSCKSPVLADGFFITEPPGKPLILNKDEQTKYINKNKVWAGRFYMRRMLHFWLWDGGDRLAGNIGGLQEWVVAMWVLQLCSSFWRLFGCSVCPASPCES